MKTHKISLLCLIVLVIFDVAYCQIYYNSIELAEDTKPDTIIFKIDQIEIIGNNKTKDYIILRELHFDVTDCISLKELFLAQKRVLNLFLFNRVIFDLVGDTEQSILIITVIERWYIFPLPLLYRNERTWSKISYGAKLLYYNFSGRNILLNLTSAFGYNPEIKFSYRNPWFGGRLKLLTNFSIFTSRVTSLSPSFQDIEDKRIGFDWLIGRRFGHFFYVVTKIGYMELQNPQITLSATGRDKLPSFSLSIQYDNRDLLEYPHNGYSITLWGKKVKFIHSINYFRYGLDLRRYVPLPNYTTLAFRGMLNLSHGRIPVYDRTYFGYLERLRGNFYKIYEGENMAIGGIEFRFPIKKISYMDLSKYALPGFSEYYHGLKFGVSAGIFYDWGVVWYQHESLSDKRFNTGFGAGLHFHLPYVELFRLEVGFNQNFNIEFIADTKVAF